LGDLSDVLTGKIFPDTHDERYRQKIASLLLKKGYKKNEIGANREVLVAAGKKKAIIKIDFEVFPAGKTDMIIKYGPGSLTTRLRSALALSRLVALREVPVVVVTNGEDAEILDGETGKTLDSGIFSIPSRKNLIEKYSDRRYPELTKKRAELEGRIAYAYEVDGACPCDETICSVQTK